MTGPGSATSSNPADGSYAAAGHGVVQSIDLVRRENTGIGGTGIGIGAIAGAVIGGVLGNQVGGGTGRTVATVAGAAGGAYAGNEIEKRTQTGDAYRITIRMDGGTVQSVTQDSSPAFRVGERVRIDNGKVSRE